MPFKFFGRQLLQESSRNTFKVYKLLCSLYLCWVSRVCIIVVLRFSKIYTLETMVTDDLYYDDTTHILGSVFCVFSYTLGCMRCLVYMCFILAMFPLKYGFIIVQYSIHANCIVYSILHPLNVRFLSWHQSAETQC